MKDCNCNRSNQGRALCPTPERCDAEETHMVDENAAGVNFIQKWLVRVAFFAFGLLILPFLLKVFS